jgi:farnesol dehydrogenase
MGSLTDADTLARAMETCDQVYHMAAYARPWAKDPAIFYNYNVTGTKNILAIAEKVGIKKVVYVSTAGIMGPSVEQITTENAPYPEKFFTLYEQSKYEAEKLALQYASRGLPVVVVNPTRIYGPGPLTATNGTVIIMDKYIRGKWRFIPGNGNSIGNYVYVHDVVQGLVQAMEYGKPGERYLLSGEDASFNDLISIMSEVSGKIYRMYRIPQSVLLFVSSMMVFYARLSGSEPVIIPDYIRKYSFDWRVSCEKAGKELGYMPVTLKQGMTNTLEWIRRGYKNLPYA